MPIIKVEVVTDETNPGHMRLAHRLADAAGEIMKSPEGRTWVRVRHVPQVRYAESGGGPDMGVLPVFVSVIRSHKPDAPELEQEARELAEIVGRECERPVENVHIVYEADGAGRVAFGGKLVH